MRIPGSSMRIPGSWRVLVLLPLVLWGCYVPAPADLTSITPGDDLRIVLSDEGRRHLSNIAGGVRGELSGDLLLLTEDSLAISTRLAGPASAGLPFANLRQILTFARSDILQVTVPELDRTRTGMAAAGIAVAAAVLLGGFVKVVSGTGEAGEAPDPTAPFRILW